MPDEIAGYFIRLEDGRKHWIWRQEGETDEHLKARAEAYAKGRPGSLIKSFTWRES